MCPVVLVCSLCVCVVPPSVFVLFYEAGQAPGQAQAWSSQTPAAGQAPGQTAGQAQSLVKHAVKQPVNRPVSGGGTVQRPLSVGSVPPLLSSVAGPLSAGPLSCVSSARRSRAGLPASARLPRSAPLSSVVFCFFFRRVRPSSSCRSFGVSAGDTEENEGFFFFPTNLVYPPAQLLSVLFFLFFFKMGR